MVLAEPALTWMEPSAGNIDPQIFSVQEMSAWAIVAKVSGVWWQSSSSWGVSDLHGLTHVRGLLTDVSGRARTTRSVVGQQRAPEDRRGLVVVVQRVG